MMKKNNKRFLNIYFLMNIQQRHHHIKFFNRRKVILTFPIQILPYFN